MNRYLWPNYIRPHVFQHAFAVGDIVTLKKHPSLHAKGTVIRVDGPHFYINWEKKFNTDFTYWLESNLELIHE